ncbi:CRP/FNR family transcriptional regulator, anaerobic regulatory protein [Clostridium acidisoli DSM 12555]|jgi:CRP/FNR family transcriptional regulator|uniref:CRP/FNR family transcriptional regulator, anaerobic regulatory protein n=1 Tax=Clostridium acidisoli DSM 12555 TaxID=1121291 RepID=A0A1W1XRR4_9CLOT|nr:Crp/Fnr family transcriptional regulator [Clostridium acidisoli]SMC26542.1 CRP/FNR family transcriptional regulator, anaerobic regulatory protein [Clostridium acidisoli DSM 12555]
MEESIELLKKIPIFSKLSEDVLLNILKLQVVKIYKKGSVIFHEYDKGDAFFFVKSGKVKIFKTSFDGRDITLNILEEGSIFAEVTLFNDINYPATAMVLEESQIGMILNKDIEKLILKNTSLALQIIKLLNKRLYKSQSTIKDMAFSDTFVRVTNVLIDLSSSHGIVTNNGIEINMNITRQDIADMVGTTRETVSRIIADLKRDGFIETNSKKIIIIDTENFKKLSNKNEE